MITPARRRKLSNIVVDPKSLALISVPFLALVAISIGIVYAIHWKVLHALEQSELHGAENLATLNTLHDIQNSVTIYGTYGLVVLALCCFALWIVFSHRIFGPTIPIRRHIQSLISGDYSSRITLRSGDQLKDVVVDLNHLAEVLQDKKK